MKEQLSKLLNMLNLFDAFKNESDALSRFQNNDFENIERDDLNDFDITLEILFQKALDLSKGSSSSELEKISAIVDETNEVKALATLKIISNCFWSEYENELESLGPKRNLDERIRILKLSQAALKQGSQFGDLPQTKRYMIAGNATSAIKDEFGVDAGLFGSMKGAGIFVGLVNQTPELFNRFFQAIPTLGVISRERYLEIVAVFKACLDEANIDKNYLVPFTRLMSMKRPDQFLCITGRNERLFRLIFEAPALNGDYERYWDDYLSPLYALPWNGDDNRLDQKKSVYWGFRVALMDVFFYQDPSTGVIANRLKALIGKESSPPDKDAALQMMFEYWSNRDNRIGFPEKFNQRKFIVPTIMKYYVEARSCGMNHEETLRLVFQAALNFNNGGGEDDSTSLIEGKIGGFGRFDSDTLDDNSEESDDSESPND